MTSSDSELDELWLLFEQDVERSLDEAEEALLALNGDEVDEPQELLNQLYRGLHSIKGNARAMGLQATEQFTHQAEDLVALCRDGVTEMAGDVLETVLEALDCLRTAMPEAVAERRDINVAADASLNALQDKLRELVQIYDVAGDREAATDADFLLFDDFDDDDSEDDVAPSPTSADSQTPPAEVASEPKTDAAAPSLNPDSGLASVSDTDPPAAATKTGFAPAGAPAVNAAGGAPTEAPNPDPPGSAPTPVAPPTPVFDSSSVPSTAIPSPAPATPPAPKPPAAKPRATSRDKKSDDLVFVQVKASRVRELLALASDLGLSADVLMTDPKVKHAAETSEALNEKIHRLRRLTRDLRFASGALALVPVADLFTRLRRVARDIGRQTDKAFDLVIKGESTEVDRFLVDQLYDPLMHVMRNAVDHGLEDPLTREKAGKAPRGKVEISASNAGQGIVLQVKDDGAGLNRAAIIEKARRKQLISEDAEISDEAALRLILLPGFSTKESVSNLSGRGVGMDVVNQAVQRLRGTLKIESTPGEGTTFKIQLPMTLTFADVLIVEVEKRSYAIPLEYIRRIFTPSANEYICSSASAEELVRIEDRSIPLLRLDTNRTQPPQTVVAVRTSRGDFALPVAQILGTEQVTLRPLSSLLSGIRGASACGLMANGEIAITLDCEKLVNHVES